MASVLLMLACAARAQPLLTIDGAGNGHGVGMSQWGAYGLALQGADYRSILAHYYPGTGLLPGPVKRVRILMQARRPTVAFTGATRVGRRGLNPAATYTARLRGGSVVIEDSRGHPVARAPVRLLVTGRGPLRLAGTALNGRTDGRYRGSLELASSGGGLDVLNVLSVDDYVRGVVAAESDPDWPLAELEAQAVASRTYAITSGRLYADTRSQQYNGVAAETRATDRAVAQTAGQVVTYRGRPAITYFFDASGGQTENVEYAFPGTSPEPWLKAVADPFDTLAPRHRWGPYRLTLPEAQARLGGLVQGTLQSIDVVRRGVSPRVVTAYVVGTGGRTRVNGVQLQSRLRLPSSWACFTVTGPNGLSAPGWDAPCRAGLGPPPSPATGDGRGGGGVAAP